MVIDQGYMLIYNSMLYIALTKMTKIETSPAQLRLAQISSECTMVLMKTGLDRLSPEQTKLNIKVSFQKNFQKNVARL